MPVFVDSAQLKLLILAVWSAVLTTSFVTLNIFIRSFRRDCEVSFYNLNNVDFQIVLTSISLQYRYYRGRIAPNLQRISVNIGLFIVKDFSDV